MNSTYDIPLDKPHRITVESALIYVRWSQGKVWADCEAAFEVRTSLVGEGAELKYRVKTDSGKTLLKDTGAIFGNRYRGRAPIPGKARPGDMVYLEVELPKLGLKGQSNMIPVCPRIVVQRMEWDRAEVRREEVVTMRARFIDIPDGTEAMVTVFKACPQDIDLPVASIPTELRNNRLEILWQFDYHDDTGRIPTRKMLEPYGKTYRLPEYFFTIDIDGVKIGENKESGLLRFKDTVKFLLKDECNVPYPATKVKITLADGTAKEAQSDQDGIVTLEDIPPGPYGDPRIDTGTP